MLGMLHTTGTETYFFVFKDFKNKAIEAHFRFAPKLFKNPSNCTLEFDVFLVFTNSLFLKTLKTNQTNNSF